MQPEKNQQRKSSLDGPPEKEQAERLLALASRNRSERHALGMQLLRQKYPHAPEAMLDTAAFHIYGDLPMALIDLGAAFEDCLRDGDPDPPYGEINHVLYHLYNCYQLDATMAWAKQDVVDSLKEVQECMKDNDRESALSLLETILDRVEGYTNAPDVEL